MNIEDVLKLPYYDIRITNYDKWLVWSTCYLVYQQKKYQKYSRRIIETDDFSEALEILIK